MELSSKNKGIVQGGMIFGGLVLIIVFSIQSENKEKELTDAGVSKEDVKKAIVKYKIGSAIGFIIFVVGWIWAWNK